MVVDVQHEAKRWIALEPHPAIAEGALKAPRHPVLGSIEGDGQPAVGAVSGIHRREAGRAAVPTDIVTASPLQRLQQRPGRRPLRSPRPLVQQPRVAGLVGVAPHKVVVRQSVGARVVAEVRLVKRDERSVHFKLGLTEERRRHLGAIQHGAENLVDLVEGVSESDEVDAHHAPPGSRVARMRSTTEPGIAATSAAATFSRRRVHELAQRQARDTS